MKVKLKQANDKKYVECVHGEIIIKNEQDILDSLALCTENDTNLIEKFAEECSTGALSREGNDVAIDEDKCILCYKCSEASKNYDNISVKIFRDRFKKVKGEASSVWNGIMLRVLGKEGKIKGIKSYSQNKLADSVLRLMGKEEEEV